MNDQSLRDALETLAEEMAYDVTDAPARIRAVLAAHPVEPALPIVTRERIEQVVREICLFRDVISGTDAVLNLLGGAAE